jgi:hypothetical protein
LLVLRAICSAFVFSAKLLAKPDSCTVPFNVSTLIEEAETRLTHHVSCGSVGGGDKTDAMRLVIWVDFRAATKTPVTEISRHGLAITKTAPAAAEKPISFNGLAFA